ncbi:MAG TPA: hypothetical protein VFN59_00930 [Acidimicrobiales bacterium]|nr:hypothetical protein [Acidimicrobiales bacterium]
MDEVDYTIGLEDGMLLLELAGVFLEVDGRPVNSLEATLSSFGLQRVPSDLVVDEPVVISADLVRVDLTRLELVINLKPIAEERIPLPLTRQELVAEFEADDPYLLLIVGEDYGLRETVVSGRQMPMNRMVEAATGGRLMAGLIRCE